MFLSNNNTIVYLALVPLSHVKRNCRLNLRGIIGAIAFDGPETNIYTVYGLPPIPCRSVRGQLAARSALVTKIQAFVRGALQRETIREQLQAHLRYGSIGFACRFCSARFLAA